MAAVRSYLTPQPEPRRERCPTCHGFGTPAAMPPACRLCGEQWSMDTYQHHLEGHDRGGVTHVSIRFLWLRRDWILARWIARLTHTLSFLRRAWRNCYRWDCTLPCGHDLLAHLTFAESTCLTCRGKGTISHFTVSADIYAGRRLCPLPKPPRQPHHPYITPMQPSRETALDGEHERIWWRAIRRHP